MKTLQFSNPTHNSGRNLTVRRGVKWALETEAEIPGLGGRKLSTRLMRFADLSDLDLELEHDPACRHWAGLFQEMRKLYPDFSQLEVVTLVEYDGTAE